MEFDESEITQCNLDKLLLAAEAAVEVAFLLLAEEFSFNSRSWTNCC